MHERGRLQHADGDEHLHWLARLEAQRPWLEQWLEAWEGFTVQMDDVEPVGKRHVVANMHQSARGKGSGVSVEMNISYLWDIREGRLAAMQLYATREEALRAAEQRERATGD